MRRTDRSIKTGMIVAAHLLVLGATAGHAQTAPDTSIDELFVGVFELAEFRAHGDDPTGRISYDRAGRMWAMLLPPGRPEISRSSTPDDYRTAMRGLVTYYGTYDIDEETGRVIHHVEAASNPAWVGDDFVRWYRFENGDLWISLNPEFENALLWARMPPG